MRPTIYKKKQKYLFYLLLALVPFNIRHIFNFEQIENIEGFRENISFSLYAFDIAFFALLLVFISAQVCTLVIHTNAKTPFLFFKKLAPIRWSLITLLFFIIIMLIASFLSSNKTVSLYNATRIIEAIIFFLITKNLLGDKKTFRNSVWIIFFSGVAQSTIAILQFATQKSIGLKFLGESIVSSNIFNVAKTEIYGEKIIRAYGTFPHPNLLGAFLLLSLACGIYLKISTKREPASFRRASSKKIIRFLYSPKIGYTLLAIILLGNLLTFSRSIWLVLFLFLIAIFLLYCFNIEKFKIHSKTKTQSLSKQIQNLKLYQVLFASGLIIFVLMFISPRLCITSCPNDESFVLRKIYSQTARKIIQTHPIIGIGPGNFVSFFIPCNCSYSLQPWEIQPVHNLYLLIASETGLLGFAIFMFFIISSLIISLKFKNHKFIKNSKSTHCILSTLVNKFKIQNFRGRLADIFSNIFLLLFLLFLLLGFFDHYFWTIPQGQFLFWLTFALVVSSKKHPLKKL